MENFSQKEYNKLTELPTASYNIIQYLIENNENIFKLLKYNEPNALNGNNLTDIEKGGMIYGGFGDMNDFKIFIDPNLDDSFLKEACILRISPVEIIPINHIVASISMGFEVYCHAKINTLNNYTTRVDNMVHELVQTLNGANIANFGMLYFNQRASSRCKIVVGGALPYKSKALVMCNYLLG